MRASAVLQPGVVSEQPTKEGNKTSPLDSVRPLSPPGVPQVAALRNSKGLCFPALSPQQLCRALTSHPAEVPAKAGDASVHHAWADGGLGWAALGVWVGGGGSVLVLRLPS